MRNQVVALIDAPNFNINQEITVTITFTFSSAGEIVVLNVDSKDTEVLNYVRKNLNQKVMYVFKLNWTFPKRVFC